MSLIKAKYFFLGLILLSLNLASSHSHGQGQGQDFNFGTVAIENLAKIDKGGKTALLGLNFKLEKGWKIYWHSAGLGALPPRIEWDKADKGENRILSNFMALSEKAGYFRAQNIRLSRQYHPAR